MGQVLICEDRLSHINDMRYAWGTLTSLSLFFYFFYIYTFVSYQRYEVRLGYTNVSWDAGGWGAYVGHV